VLLTRGRRSVSVAGSEFSYENPSGTSRDDFGKFGSSPKHTCARSVGHRRRIPPGSAGRLVGQLASSPFFPNHRHRVLESPPTCVIICLKKAAPQQQAAWPKSCVDVYGPCLIATVCLVLVSRSRLLTYIRLLRAARYIVAASPDGFPLASPSSPLRHRC